MHFDIVSNLGVTVKDTGFSVANTMGIKADHSTFHRWVLRTDADEIKMPEDTVASIPGARPPKPVQVFADGTKSKGVGDDGPKGHGHAKQGDIKVLLGEDGFRREADGRAHSRREERRLHEGRRLP